MPTAQEHKKKYQDNKEVLNSVFDCNNKLHCNWIVTISFYISLHIIEAKLAKEQNLHSRDPRQRDEMIENCGLFSRNVKSKYKQLKSNCWSARYSKNDMAPTIANQMKRFAEEIEAEVFPEQNK